MHIHKLYISPVTCYTRLEGQGQGNPLLTVNAKFENNQSQSLLIWNKGHLLQFQASIWFLFMSINVNSCRLGMPPGYIKSDGQHYTDTQSLIRALNIETPASENGPISPQGPGGHSTHTYVHSNRQRCGKGGAISVPWVVADAKNSLYRTVSRSMYATESVFGAY